MGCTHWYNQTWREAQTESVCIYTYVCHSLTGEEHNEAEREWLCIICKESSHFLCTISVPLFLVLFVHSFGSFFFPFLLLHSFSQRLISISANIENNKNHTSTLFLASQKYYCLISKLTSLYTSSFYISYIHSIIYIIIKPWIFSANYIWYFLNSYSHAVLVNNLASIQWRD